MTTTRCANPEYQLDVDLMTIEYLLYHAIGSRLKALKTVWGTDKIDGSPSDEAADRLLETFNTILQLFKHNHPTNVFTARTAFNIKILELLVLLYQWQDDRPASDALLYERQLSSEYRRACLRAWCVNQHEFSQGLKSMILESHASPFKIAKVELNDIMLHFFDLSAEISYVAGPVNEQWYELASEFMLQCAMERLHILEAMEYLHDRDSSDVGDLVTFVSECFAWGITRPDSPEPVGGSDAEDILDTQFLADQVCIHNMFETNSKNQPIMSVEGEDCEMLSAEDGKAGKHTSREEDPIWTQLRDQKHATILLVVMDCDAKSTDCICQQRLIDIGKSHELPKFLNQIIRFIENIWVMNIDSLGGKPILVQIEEGGLDGMKDVRFKEFLDRVGLKLGKPVGTEGKRNVKWAR